MVRGRHFEHEKINSGIMLDVFEASLQSSCGVHEGTWCADISWRWEKSSGKMLLIHDFLLYEDREENGYPQRSHDYMPVETDFARGFELAQDVEIREKNAGHKRTMHMWKNALNHVWNTKKLKSQLIECQKLWKP